MTDRSGFQGSERTGCRVVFYRQGRDEGVVIASGTGTTDGSYETDDDPSIIALQTNKHLGQAGSFALSLKCPRGMSLFDWVMDDDWVDVHFTRGDDTWHVIRGSVDSVRRSTSVGGAGTTVTTWTVEGRDFQKVFESTPIHFDVFSNRNIEGGAAMQISRSEAVSFSVQASVDLFLRGFLRQLGTQGRANWLLPRGMPGVPASRSFIDTVVFDYASFTNNPPRIAKSQSFLMPGGTAWELAATWSDPTFCELYTEQYPASGPRSFDGRHDLTTGLSQSDTAMTVVFRDKPFVVHDPGAGTAVDQASPWFDLPLFVVPRQHVVAQDTLRSTFERFNAFFVTCQLSQELLHEAGLGPTQANWDPVSILYHGFRRMDVVCTYEPVNIAVSLAKQRLMARDWYAINPYLYNGSISLGRGMPDAKIGTRVRIPGDTSATDETYYIEGVQHSWQLPSGMRTTLAVTRGYIGTDADLINLVTAVTDGYTDQTQANPGVPAPNEPPIA